MLPFCSITFFFHPLKNSFMLNFVVLRPRQFPEESVAELALLGVSQEQANKQRQALD